MTQPFSEDQHLNAWWNGAQPDHPQDFAAWLTQHRLLSLYVWRAAQHKWTLAPDVVAAERAYRYKVIARQSLAKRQLEWVGKEAQARSIPVIVLKGHGLAEHYPSNYLRPYTDIDLLAPPERAGELFDAFLKAGYRVTESEFGVRTWHYPPIEPPHAGIVIELHTAMSDAPDLLPFTCEAWQAGMQPWNPCPGLWLPGPVDHVMYLVYHAVIKHAFEMGLLLLADFRFLLHDWNPDQWHALAAKSQQLGLERAAGLVFALSGWFWQESWAEAAQGAFSPAPQEVLLAAQQMILGMQQQPLPRVWRDLPARNVAGGVEYAGNVFRGASAYYQQLPIGMRIRYVFTRLAKLVANYAPLLWRGLLGDARLRASWRRQRDFYAWVSPPRERER